LLPSDRLISKVFLTDEAHSAILAAIASKDPAQARKAMIEHMREGVDLMVKAVIPAHPPSDDLGA
jgi:DNA-binding GntR family transcriptional regulator